MLEQIHDCTPNLIILRASSPLFTRGCVEPVQYFNQPKKTMPNSRQCVQGLLLSIEISVIIVQYNIREISVIIMRYNIKD